MIASILLSAGLSQRFGSPKALAMLNNETIIRRLQKMFLRTQVDEIVVVLGAYADKIKPHLLNHKKVKFVYNKDYNFGQTSSFKAGLQAVSGEIQGVLLQPVDYPLVKPETIDLIIERFRTKPCLTVLPTYEDKKGHPPLFSVSLKNEFLALADEKGLNTVVRLHQKDTAFLPVEDAGVIRTFNTQAEFDNLRQIV